MQQVYDINEGSQRITMIKQGATDGAGKPLVNGILSLKIYNPSTGRPAEVKVRLANLNRVV